MEVVDSVDLYPPTTSTGLRRVSSTDRRTDRVGLKSSGATDRLPAVALVATLRTSEGIL
jgi:hypothetical protein